MQHRHNMRLSPHAPTTAIQNPAELPRIPGPANAEFEYRHFPAGAYRRPPARAGRSIRASRSLFE